jgi:vacuolar-type H+-ATPase subunit I/STV1
MAKTKNNHTTDIVPVEITDIDYETGEIINKSDMEQRLFFLEQRMALDLSQIVYDLKEIRDYQFYQCRGYRSMHEYVDECLPFSIATVKRFLQIADALSENALKKLDNAPIKLLLEIARNEELRDEANSEDADVNDIVKRAKELERKKLQKKINDYESVLSGKDTLLRNSEEAVQRQREEIERLEKALNEIAATKDIDRDRFVYINQKQDAISLIQDVLTTNLKLLSDITKISHELMNDPEIAGMLVNAMAALKTGIYRIEETYFMQLTTANNNIDILPEDDNV